MVDLLLRSPAADELPMMQRLYQEMYQAISSGGLCEAVGTAAPPEDWVANVHRQSLAGERTYWFAFLNEEIIGFVDFKVMSFHPGSQEKFARIFDLYIAAKMQRQGYGTQLARKAIDAAIEQGANSIELNVLPDNQVALAFWQSFGFNLQLYVLQLAVS